ncbi:hypothetical protein JDV02_003269 [Purpureocillium takamizusanense]|uniref:Protein kinase domain-containing protein n=1 Tax=Purpureocillium takamizusanense TaxID=2060973 RepID=A0A9Q8QCS4_9HYPO|nr:uncharacterized protein JDV02_003269 [Purpureocillium takamizusanense]UNI16872.1 hypothetical protein JDV02_003269 [Purpureocillium takamizusanense]
MPQVSSIVREHDTTNQPTAEGREHLERIVLERLRQSPDIFSIFTLTASFDIPFCDLPSLKGIPDEHSELPARSHGLGTGVSCTVTIHRTGHAERDEYPSGTLVALKKYSATPDDLPGGGQANRRLCQLLWQELSVFTHPYLRHHEHICKLLYIGWESNSIVPSLALELAQYGTLEDCLQHLRSYHSSLRKAHLSCDIALGLAAIHACGLVHGDIKPGNIIIQAHSSRSIVAKLSDFNGVSPAESYGSNSYSFGTPEWQAPEAMIQEAAIDWQLCDVYSFAMVIATIWTRSGYIPPGGSFLDTCLQYKLDTGEKRTWALNCKLTHDESDTSLLRLALSEISETELNIPLAGILASGLSTQPTRRFPMATMITTCFANFAAETGRDLSFAPDTALVSNMPYDTADAFGTLFVLEPKYINRSRTFKETMLKALLAAGTELRSAVQMPAVFDLKKGITVSDEGLYDFLKIQDNRVKAALAEHDSLYRLARVAASISLSYLLGIGTSVREHFARAWLCVAAGAGEGNTTHLFGPLEQSIMVDQSKIPRRLWCAFGTLTGYLGTAECLKDMDPSLYEVAIRMHRRRHWGRPSPQIVRIEPYLPDWIAEIREDHELVDRQVPSRRGHRDINETALHLCAATGDLESARYLVGSAGANINALNARNETPIFYATRAGHFEMAKFLFEQGAEVDRITTEGYAITHFLSMMDDDHGAELAPLYVERGAVLDVAAEVPQKVFSDNFTRGRGVPLFWAALKLRPLLFKAFLEMHTRADFRISRADVLQLLTLLATLNLHAMLDATLELAPRIIDLAQDLPRDPDIDIVGQLFHSLSLDSLGEDGQLMNPALATALLYNAMTTWPPIVLHRRYISRDKFSDNKERTLSLLLQLGADPLASASPPTSGGEGEDNEQEIPLTLAVYTGDTLALRLFLRHITDRGIDPLPYLADPGRYGGYSALQRSIYCDSRDIFFYLLDEYPSLVELVGDKGRRPLHSAATQEWTGYATALLRRGASPYDRSQDRSTPFTWALMRNPSLEVVDVLVEHCDDMDRILGHDEQSGFTAFGKLLSALISYRMDFGIDRLRYLVNRFGTPPFFTWVHKTQPWSTTVFRTVLLQKTSPTDGAHLALEMSVLEFLLDLYPEKIDFIDYSGRAALHYAAMYGNSSAVELLLHRGAAAGLETQASHASLDPTGQRGFVGYTALDLAVKYQRVGPGEEVLRGGRREIVAWDANMQKTIRILVEADGGQSGSGVRLHDGLLTATAARHLSNVHIGSSRWPH